MHFAQVKRDGEWRDLIVIADHPQNPLVARYHEQPEVLVERLGERLHEEVRMVDHD